MSKRKNISEKIEKPKEYIDTAIAALDDLSKTRLIAILQSEDLYDKDTSKMVTDVMTKAFALSIALGDLKNHISKIKKSVSNKRFSSERVISNFLNLN